MGLVGEAAAAVVTAVAAGLKVALWCLGVAGAAQHHGVSTIITAGP